MRAVAGAWDSSTVASTHWTWEARRAPTWPRRTWADGMVGGILLARANRQPAVGPRSPSRCRSLKTNKITEPLGSRKMDKPSDAATAEAVRVLVRVRPLSGTETASGAQPCVDVDGVANHITVTGRETMTFDNVADEASTQVSVYEATAAPLLEQAAKGFNGSIIAYGQTGSGKTHTMGTADLSSEITEMSGVIPRLSHDIFEMAKRDGAHTCTEIKVSFLEIYNEEIIDLLAPKESRGEKLAVRGDKNVEVVGLTHAVVGTVGEMQVKLQQVRNDRIAECGVRSAE